MIHKQKGPEPTIPKPRLTEEEFEVLLRASGTSDVYRKREGVDELALKYSSYVSHPDAVTAIRLILGIKVLNPSQSACELAQEAMESASVKPLTFERFGRRSNR